MRAVRIPDGSIKIDGELDEQVWQTAEPAKDFVQSEPDTNQPSTERTEVRALYDSSNLYLGAWCYVKDRRTVTYFEYFRDFNPSNTDTFEIVIDTFYDKRNSVAFVSNPLGATWDAEFSNNGGVMNQAWEVVWHIKSRVTDEGFFLEFAIPFRSLRYKQASGEQVWGINFQRRIRHRVEHAYWSMVPRPFILPRMSLAGTLTGLQNLPKVRNLKITPYGLAGFTTTPPDPGASPTATSTTKVDYNGGVDVKYGLGNNLTLDLTLNPDFSNVEADVQQVNLTRFNLFFPERRGFFLENSTIFDIRRTRKGNGGQVISAGFDLIPFFSRTIGLSALGQPLTVLGGARLTGRVRGGFDVGLLNIHTGEDQGQQGESFTVVRTRKKLLENSEIGFILTDRQTRDSPRFNRLVGTDVHFQLKRYLDLSGLLMVTDDEQTKDSQRSYSLAASWRDSFWEWDAGVIDIGDNFNPGMGFVPRRGIRKFTGGFAVHPRLDRFGIREYSPFIREDYILDQENVVATKLLEAGIEVTFQNAAVLQLAHAGSFERLQEPFFIGKGVVIPQGDCRFDNWSAYYGWDTSRRISGSVGIEDGSFYGGTKRTYSTGIAFRPNEHLTTSLNYSRNLIDQPGGSFTSDLVGLQIDYGFSPTQFFNAFIQYNTFANQFNTNLRFNIIHHPLSNLFVTYNDIRDTRDLGRVNRVLAIKFTQLLQF